MITVAVNDTGGLRRHPKGVQDGRHLEFYSKLEIKKAEIENFNIRHDIILKTLFCFMSTFYAFLLTEKGEKQVF